MSNQIIYNNEQGSRFLFRYGLRKRAAIRWVAALSVFRLTLLVDHHSLSLNLRSNSLMLSISSIKVGFSP